MSYRARKDRSLTSSSEEHQLWHKVRLQLRSLDRARSTSLSLASNLDAMLKPILQPGANPSPSAASLEQALATCAELKQRSHDELGFLDLALESLGILLALRSSTKDAASTPSADAHQDPVSSAQAASGAYRPFKKQRVASGDRLGSLSPAPSPSPGPASKLSPPIAKTEAGAAASAGTSAAAAATGSSCLAGAAASSTSSAAAGAGYAANKRGSIHRADATPQNKPALRRSQTASSSSAGGGGAGGGGRAPATTLAETKANAAAAAAAAAAAGGGAASSAATLPSATSATTGTSAHGAAGSAGVGGGGGGGNGGGGLVATTPATPTSATSGSASGNNYVDPARVRREVLAHQLPLQRGRKVAFRQPNKAKSSGAAANAAAAAATRAANAAAARAAESLAREGGGGGGGSGAGGEAGGGGGQTGGAGGSGGSGGGAGGGGGVGGGGTTTSERQANQAALAKRAAALSSSLQNVPGQYEEGETWIMATIVECINNDRNRYVVQDAEDQNAPEYNTTLKAIVPLPESLQTLPGEDYVRGAKVMGLYPDTSCFYQATVVGGGPGLTGLNPRSLSKISAKRAQEYLKASYQLEFDDDGGDVKDVPAYLVVERP